VANFHELIYSYGVLVRVRSPDAKVFSVFSAGRAEDNR